MGRQYGVERPQLPPVDLKQYPNPPWTDDPVGGTLDWFAVEILLNRQRKSDLVTG